MRHKPESESRCYYVANTAPTIAYSGDRRKKMTCFWQGTGHSNMTNGRSVLNCHMSRFFLFPFRC
jgi:hypothetical protein